MLNRKGFTLVEIMAVIALIAILLGGATVIITTTINKQKEKVRLDEIETVKDAAVTYVLNKKFFVPVCKTNAGALVEISQDNVKALNNEIKQHYESLRGNFSGLNSNTNLKNYFGGNKTTGASGVLGTLKDDKCYKMVSVETLIKEGFVESADDCRTSDNVPFSVIVVYAKGDSGDPNGAGTLVAVTDPNFCAE